MNLYIKNMVCGRCVDAVRTAFEQAGLPPEEVALGRVTLRDEKPAAEALERVDALLKQAGFERINDRKSRLIEAVKNEVISRIHHSERLDLKTNWSALISEALHHEYNYISSLFSSVEGVTLEHYIIRQKIEKAKELLFYEEHTLSEIADRLGYSSVAHLSGQFKKITGLTPTQLKKSLRDGRERIPLDKVS
ncbi:MAG TPA: helix-turn-helix domain-containing protein [Cyclobacteriaceae bacterium]|nr:helix-turn-helix domain-containing protein [Cyclobacteriaceae bacterium]